MDVKSYYYDSKSSIVAQSGPMLNTNENKVSHRMVNIHGDGQDVAFDAKLINLVLLSKEKYKPIEHERFLNNLVLLSKEN